MSPKSSEDWTFPTWSPPTPIHWTDNGRPWQPSRTVASGWWPARESGLIRPPEKVMQGEPTIILSRDQSGHSSEPAYRDQKPSQSAAFKVRPLGGGRRSRHELERRRLGWRAQRITDAFPGISGKTKKTAHAARDRPDVADARAEWKAWQPSLDPTKPVFMTKPAPPPTWRAVAVGVPVVNIWLPPCLMVIGRRQPSSPARATMGSRRRWSSTAR